MQRNKKYKTKAYAGASRVWGKHKLQIPYKHSLAISVCPPLPAFSFMKLSAIKINVFKYFFSKRFSLLSLVIKIKMHIRVTLTCVSYFVLHLVYPLWSDSVKITRNTHAVHPHPSQCTAPVARTQKRFACLPIFICSILGCNSSRAYYISQVELCTCCCCCC